MQIKEINATKLPDIGIKRVAAYARVSSEKGEALHSLSAQISYYNEYISNHIGWEFAGVYADEGISGTKDSRPEFQRLLADCRKKRIDLVITKSITRFARNTVTPLDTIRELKLLNIDVLFEKENLHSLGANGELMLTLLAMYAEEEARSASENQKWRIQKMFEEGRPNTGRMLGYCLKDGQLTIIPEEAEIVRMIFDDYLSGMGRLAIAKKLNAIHVPTVRGCDDWREGSIYRILHNEKYTGDMILQKPTLRIFERRKESLTEVRKENTL
jgi:site-specific DNA recombinase